MHLEPAATQSSLRCGSTTSLHPSLPHLRCSAARLAGYCGRLCGLRQVVPAVCHAGRNGGAAGVRQLAGQHRLHAAGPLDPGIGTGVVHRHVGRLCNNIIDVEEPALGRTLATGLPSGSWFQQQYATPRIPLLHFPAECNAQGQHPDGRPAGGGALPRRAGGVRASARPGVATCRCRLPARGAGGMGAGPWAAACVQRTCHRFEAPWRSAPKSDPHSAAGRPLSVAPSSPPLPPPRRRY